MLPTADRPSPKIELHVHLEGTVRPATLLAIARRNRLALPADSIEGLAALYRFRDFAHFLSVWELTTNCLRTAEDFRQVVVDYAAEAALHGAVYLEGIFSPAERAMRGVSYEELFTGYCDGAQQAEELFGVTVRLTPDLHWGVDPDEAERVARHAIAFRERGIVALGIGGAEGAAGPERYAAAFALARAGGLGSVPHAGETLGPPFIRAVLEHLQADRLRHGIRASEDPTLLAELAERGTVLDVCPTSNVRTRVVASLAEHPLPQLVAAGVACSVATDDPAMFDTDLTREYALLEELQLSPELAYRAGLAGACCDDATRRRLEEVAAGEWGTVAPSARAALAPVVARDDHASDQALRR